jgi:hypothetical protein
MPAGEITHTGTLGAPQRDVYAQPMTDNDPKHSLAGVDSHRQRGGTTET